MRYAFDDAGAAERRETQYFEMFCNRGIYHEGWTAVTRHSTPWVIGARCRRSPTTPGSSTTRTPTGARRTTSRPRCPRSSTSCKALFMEEARKYNVLPLDDRRVERFNSDLAGRPTLITGQLAAALRRHGPADRERGASTSRTSRTRSPPSSTVPDGGAEGVIVAQGGAFAGWSLYVKDGRPKYCYNLFGLQRFHVEGDAAIPPGTHQVRMEFAYDGGGLGKGGDGRALRRRREDRRGPRRGHRADDLLGRRDLRRRLRHRLAGQRRLHARRAAASPARSSGCRSTSPTPPRTSTT